MTRLKLEPSEGEFQASVVELAELAGWRVLHVRPVTDQRSRTRTPTTCIGWPDLCLWRPGRFMAAELKAERGRLSPAQRDVLDSLAAAGVECHVWRPSDWPAIEAVLRGRSRLLDAWQGR